ncbi:MAG: hypothetical protein KKC18_10605 [Chloroflexi bacterium]|nr:hypothetical protein [Chloroflexota bacterium]
MESDSLRSQVIALAAAGTPMPTGLIDKGRMARAFGLLLPEPQDGYDAIVTTFGQVQMALASQVASCRAVGRPTPQIPMAGLSASLNYVWLRLQTVFARLYQLDWMRDTLSGRTDDEVGPWYTVAALAVRDFHTDVAAVMDSVPIAILRTYTRVSASDCRKPPGFADLQEGSKRSYRKRLPEAATQLIDATDRWWPTVKKVRDVLMHRPHSELVFGSPRMGVLFRLTDSDQRPLITETAFEHEGSSGVVSFCAYAAFVLGELLLLLDDLADSIVMHTKMSTDGLPPSIHLGRFAQYWSEMDRLSAP